MRAMNLPSDTLPLHCHPATPAPAVRALTARARRTAEGLTLTFLLQGDIARLRIARPQTQPAYTERLWEQTCFEAFIARAGEAGYREFNFAPSGDWAIYAFSAYRTPLALDPLPAPRIVAQQTDGRLELDVHLAHASLPCGNGAWDIGLSAVVEAADLGDGRHSYWALRHAAERPDFHRRESFTLRLD